MSNLVRPRLCKALGRLLLAKAVLVRAQARDGGCGRVACGQQHIVGKRRLNCGNVGMRDQRVEKRAAGKMTLRMPTPQKVRETVCQDSSYGNTAGHAWS